MDTPTCDVTRHRVGHSLKQTACNDSPLPGGEPGEPLTRCVCVGVILTVTRCVMTVCRASEEICSREPTRRASASLKMRATSKESLCTHRVKSSQTKESRSHLLKNYNFPSDLIDRKKIYIFGAIGLVLRWELRSREASVLMLTSVRSRIDHAGQFKRMARLEVDTCASMVAHTTTDIQHTCLPPGTSNVCTHTHTHTHTS